jgi:hypothetical protein
MNITVLDFISNLIDHVISNLMWSKRLILV